MKLIPKAVRFARTDGNAAEARFNNHGDCSSNESHVSRQIFPLLRRRISNRLLRYGLPSKINLPRTTIGQNASS